MVRIPSPRGKKPVQITQTSPCIFVIPVERAKEFFYSGPTPCQAGWGDLVNVVGPTPSPGYSRIADACPHPCPWPCGAPCRKHFWAILPLGPNQCLARNGKQPFPAIKNRLPWGPIVFFLNSHRIYFFDPGELKLLSPLFIGGHLAAKLPICGLHRRSSWRFSPRLATGRIVSTSGPKQKSAEGEGGGGGAAPRCPPDFASIMACHKLCKGLSPCRLCILHAHKFLSLK